MIGRRHYDVRAPRRAHAPAAVGVVLLVLTISCARPAIQLPSGAGEPYPDHEAVLDQATRGCRGTKTLTAELALSGRAGKRRLRGRALAALGTPARIRLEGLAPFGAPAFILVADGPGGTLLLPRDRRVLRGAPAAEIIEALTGVRLDVAELLALVSGCAAPDPVAAGGTRYGDKWIAIALEGGATVYLDARRPREIVAARVRTLTVEYAEFVAGRPSVVRVRSSAGDGAIEADLTIRVSEVETNVTLESNVFELDVPADAAPLTLEELRGAGPLGTEEGSGF